MSRRTVLLSGLALCLTSVLAACGQAGSDGSTTQAVTNRPIPRPVRHWECEATGKDGDVFGNYTGVGLTQAIAQSNALAACKANPDYASCWIDSCRQIL